MAVVMRSTLWLYSFAPKIESSFLGVANHSGDEFTDKAIDEIIGALIKVERKPYM